MLNHWRRLVAALTLFLVATGVVVFVLVRDGDKEVAPEIQLPEPPVLPEAPVQRAFLTDPEGIAFIQEEITSGGEQAVKALKDVGAPLMSNPQRYVVQQTAKQTIKEVVLDLGNFWASWGFAGGKGINDRMVFRVRHPLLRNVKIKRLVEAGRREPERIGGLLSKKVAEVIRHYPNAVDVSKRFLKGEWKDDPEGWKRASTYSFILGRPNSDSPHTRRWEIEFATINALYVLAHLDYEPTIDTVVQVARMKKPRACRYTGFLVWCADRSLRQFPREELSEPALSALAEYRRLLKGVDLSARTVEVSRWNALWDIRDPMMAMSGADISSFPTFPMLELPTVIDKAFTKQEMEDILSAFLRVYDAAKEHARTE